MSLGPSRGLFGGGLFLGSEWYPCYIIFRLDKTASGKRPTDTYFRVSHADFVMLRSEFRESDNVIELEE